MTAIIMSNAGEVEVAVNESVREYDAVPDSDSAIKTGTPVKVVEAIDGSTRLVEELDSLIV